MGKGSTWDDDWYEYDAANNSWVQKSNFWGCARQNGLAASSGNYGYVGLGSANISYSVSEMYKYDLGKDN